MKKKKRSLIDKFITLSDAEKDAAVAGLECGLLREADQYAKRHNVKRST